MNGLAILSYFQRRQQPNHKRLIVVFTYRVFVGFKLKLPLTLKLMTDTCQQLKRLDDFTQEVFVPGLTNEHVFS